MRPASAGVGDVRDAARVGIPRLHRRSLVGRGERRENHRARVDVDEIALHDLTFVPFGRVAVVAAHRVDRLPAGRTREGGGASAELIRPGRPGEVDAWHGSTLERVEQRFVALGNAGSDAYAGLESFPNP